MTGIGWTGWKNCRKAGDRALQGLEAQPKNCFTLPHSFSHHCTNIHLFHLPFVILGTFHRNLLHRFMWKCIHYLFVYSLFPIADAMKAPNTSCSEHSSAPIPNPSLTQSGKRIHLRSTSSMSAKGQLLSFFFETKTLGSTNSLILKQSCHTLAELSELCTLMPVLGELPCSNCGRDLVGDPVTLMKKVHFIFNLHDLPKTGAKTGYFF